MPSRLEDGMAEHRRRYLKRLGALRAEHRLPDGRESLRALRRATRPPADTSSLPRRVSMLYSTRTLAITFAVLLLVVLVVVVAEADGAPARGDRVDRLPTAKLERLSILAAATGGIRSTRHGDATPWMRRLSRELVERAYAGDAERWALCVVARESGFNPGAVSHTDDHGLAQIHRPSHPWVHYGRLHVDPPYAVAVMVRLSNRGRSRSPWRGYGYAC